MLLTALAFAGSLELVDDAEVLDPVDEENLVTQVRTLPYDAYVLTTDAEPDAAALLARVKAARTKSRQIAIGVSPRLRRTEVQVGGGLGLSRGEIDGLATAGDASFKTRNWFGGITTILDQANRPAAADAPVVVAPARKPIDLTKDDPSVPILAVIGGVLVAATGIAFFVLRRMSGRLKDAETKLPD